MPKHKKKSKTGDAKQAQTDTRTSNVAELLGHEGSGATGGSQGNNGLEETVTTKRESMSDCSQATKPQQPVADANSLGMHAGGDGFKELQEVYSVGKDGDNARESSKSQNEQDDLEGKKIDVQEKVHRLLELKEMIDNSALKFWFKNVLCLQELKKCFEKVIDPVCKEFHQKMMKELKTKGYTALRPMCCIKATIDYDRSEITCKAHNKTTSLDNLKGFCLDTKPDSNGEVVKLYCSCHNCDGILTHLRNSCYQNFDFEEVNLANSSLDQLFRSPYQLIKLYMNKGQGKSAISPSDIDISALISCVHNCSFVREKFTNILGDLNEVRLNRNDIFHEFLLNVSKKDFLFNTGIMIKLLDKLMKFDGIAKEASETAKKKIHEIRTANFEITLQHRDSVLEELRSELKKTDMKVEELEKVISVIQNQLKQIDNELKEARKGISEHQGEITELQDELKESINWFEGVVETINEYIKEQRLQQQELKQGQQELKQGQQELKQGQEELKQGQEEIISHLRKQQTKQEQMQTIDEKDCDKFQQDLIEEYRHKFSKMNRSAIHDGINEVVEKVPFDEFYSDIDIRCSEGKNVDSLLDIFADDNCRNILIKGRNILIKGVFGVGKSTFCRKLMLAWCQAKSRDAKTRADENMQSLPDTETMEEALSRFQYLFFVDQGKGNYSTIQEAILSSLCRLPNCQEMLEHIFKEKSQAVLIIVDGFDEYPNIEFKGVNQRTVLMTTDQSHCDKICSKVDFKIDKVLTISGLNEEGISNLRYKIIQSYNKTSPHDNIESMSQECKERLTGLDLSQSFTNPFMLKTLVIGWLDEKIKPSETCNLLEMLKLFALRTQNKSKAKTETQEKKGTNSSSREGYANIPFCLRDNKTLNPHMDMMLKLGEHVYRGLIDSSQFESFNIPMRESYFDKHFREDFESCAKTMGILTKQTFTPEQDEKEITLSFIHHHFEQFFTALWIVCNQCKNEEWLSSSKDFVTDENKKARILSFVCGLNSMLGSQLSRHVIEMVTNDKELNKFRLEQTSSDCEKARGQYIHRESILDCFEVIGSEDENKFVKIVQDAQQCLEKITDILLQCKTEVSHSGTTSEALVIADVVQNSKPLTENLVQLLEQSNEQLLTLFLYNCTVDSFPNLERLSKAVSASGFLKALAIEITQAEGINLAVNFNLSSLAQLRTCDILLPDDYHCKITLGENHLLESFQCRGVQMTQQEWFELFMHLCESPKLSLLHFENASTVPTDEHTNHPAVGTEAEEINLPTGFRMHMTTVELPTSIWQYIFQLPQMEHLTLLELNDVHIDFVDLDKASHLLVLWMSDVQSTEVIFPKSNMLGELSVKKSTFSSPLSWPNLFASLTNEMKRIHLEAVDITAAVFSEQLCSNIEKVSLIDVSMTMTYFDNLKLILDQKDDGHFTSSQTGNVVNLEFEVGVGTGYSS